MSAQETHRTHKELMRDIAQHIQAQFHEAELAAARSRSAERAREAFEVGLWLGTLLAGAAGLGLGYALGVQSKMAAPAARKDA